MAIKQDLANSIYATLQNVSNSEYRCNEASELSTSKDIPACLFKMIKLDEGSYAIQNQLNYKYFQNTITTMASEISSDKQKWIIPGIIDGLSKSIKTTVRNVHNKELMTRRASQLSDSAGEDEDWKLTPLLCNDTRKWMGENWTKIANKPLVKLCLPGSHDAGMYHLTHHTEFSSDSNTKTQLFDIQMQLMQGIRYFDLRPGLWDGEFFPIHGSTITNIGYQGSAGGAMESIFQQIAAFLQEPEHEHELIILDLSSFKDVTNSQVKQRFVDLLNKHLKSRLICGSSNTLRTSTLATLMTGKRNVLALLPGGNGTDSFADYIDAAKGIWRNTDCLPSSGSGYSDTDNLGELTSDQEKKLLAFDFKPGKLFCLSWQLTLQGASNTPSQVASYVPFLTAGNILNNADSANKLLAPTLKKWMGGDKLSSNKNLTINTNRFPNILQTDACHESITHAVDMAIKICAS